MPLHVNKPGTKNLVFVHPKEGKFHITTDEGTQEYSTIEGTLELVRIEFDPGNPANKIMPYDAFIMHIEDEDKVYRIKMNIERNFTFSVARVLADLAKGEHICATAKPGNDATVTFCNIVKAVKNGDQVEWVRPISADFPADKADRVAFVKKVVESHPAYSAKKEASSE